MQEQSGESHEQRREERAREIFSFQEVAQPPPPEMNRGLQYLIGLVIGCIPLALFFLAIGRLLGSDAVNNLSGSIALYGYLALWPAAVVCLCISRVRFVGYGLLTMAIISPVIWVMSCFATFRSCYRGCR